MQVSGYGNIDKQKFKLTRFDGEDKRMLIKEFNINMIHMKARFHAFA